MVLSLEFQFQNMRIAIFDDEEDSRSIIKNYLNSTLNSFELVGEADSIQSGISFLNMEEIDLLFLDIQFPNGTAFEILNAIEEITFDIIFITAYDEFAIKAIKHNALDYILKPINREEFKKAVSKKALAPKTVSKDSVSKVQMAFETKIKLPSSSGFHLVDLKEIIRCEADGNYCKFHIHSGGNILVSKTMGDYEDRLLSNGFLRVHHSHIVNPNFIKEYIRGRGGDLIMKDGSRVSVSDSKKKDFLQWLK